MLPRYKHKYIFNAHHGHAGAAWRKVTILCEYDQNARAVAIKALALRLKNNGHKPAVKWTLELLTVERNHKLISKHDRLALNAKPLRPAPDRALTDGVMKVLAEADKPERKERKRDAFEQAVDKAAEEIRAHDAATAKKLENYQLVNRIRKTGLLIG